MFIQRPFGEFVVPRDVNSSRVSELIYIFILSQFHRLVNLSIVTFCSNLRSLTEETEASKEVQHCLIRTITGTKNEFTILFYMYKLYVKYNVHFIYKSVTTLMLSDFIQYIPVIINSFIS